MYIIFLKNNVNGHYSVLMVISFQYEYQLYWFHYVLVTFHHREI